MACGITPQKSTKMQAGPVLGRYVWTLRPSDSTAKEQTVTSEQEAQLERLETELAIAEKQLRLVQVKKLIAETELDILGLHQTLQQQAEETAVRQF